MDKKVEVFKSIANALINDGHEIHIITGIKSEDAIFIEKNIKPNAKRYEINGEKLTIKEISKKYNINKNTITSKIKKGLVGSDIIKLDKPRIKYININGEEISMKEAAKRYGIKRNTLSERLRRGCSIEEAIKK